MSHVEREHGEGSSMPKDWHIQRWPKKTSARLRELATVLWVSSRNLADGFLANAVQQSSMETGIHFDFM